MRYDAAGIECRLKRWQVLSFDDSHQRSVDAPLGIEKVESDGQLVLLLTGELDNSNGHMVLDELEALDRPVTLDTKGLTFLDSRGLMTLITARDMVGAERFQLRVVPRGPVDRLLGLTGLTNQFRITADPDQA